MAIFECLCCDFSTPKKNDYTAHLATKKHLKNAESNNTPSVNIVHPMPNGVQNNELLQIIKDLEAELKLKNEIIKMKDDVIETLKHQLSHIPQKPQEQPKTKPIQIKVTTVDTLNQDHNKAITIDEFKYFFGDEKYNKYIKNVDGSGFTDIIKSLKSENYIEGCYNTIVDLICSAVNVLPKEKRPFYCTDKHRCHFYVNTKEQGWINCDAKQLEKYLLILIQYCSWFMCRDISYTFNNLNDEQFFQTYQKHKSDFEHNIEFGKQTLIRKFTITSDDYDNIIKHLKRDLCEFTNKDNSNYKISSYFSSNNDENYDSSESSSSSESEQEIEKRIKKRKDLYLKTMN
jgi:hypothetical protein